MTAWPGLHSWLVVFEPTTSAWWGRFLARGFGHCWAMGFDPAAKAWVCVEPLFEGTMVRVASPEVVAGVFLRAERGELRLLSVPHVGVEVRRPRLCVTCAGAVASLLGLRRFPLTPWGLFWTLRRIPGVRELGLHGREEVEHAVGDGAERAGAGSGGPGGAGEGAGRGPASA